MYPPALHVFSVMSKSRMASSVETSHTSSTRGKGRNLTVSSSLVHLFSPSQSNCQLLSNKGKQYKKTHNSKDIKIHSKVESIFGL